MSVALGRLATGSGIGSPYCVGHNVLSSLAHASFGDPYVGDTCDLSGVGSTLSHVDNSGVTATSNERALCAVAQKRSICIGCARKKAPPKRGRCWRRQAPSPLVPATAPTQGSVPRSCLTP